MIGQSWLRLSGRTNDEWRLEDTLGVALRGGYMMMMVMVMRMMIHEGGL